MTHRPTTFCLATLVALAASTVLGQTYDRKEVARALLEAESLRASYRIQFEPVFREGGRPAEADRVQITRLTDGTGRYREETTRPPNSRNADSIVQLQLWNGTLTTQEFFVVGKEKTARHTVLVTESQMNLDRADMLGPSLGLRCSKAGASVGQLLSDPSILAEIRGSTLSGLPIVEVKIVGPAMMPNAIITFRYDPQEHWLLREWEMAAMGREEGKSPVEGPTYFLSKNVNSDFRRIGDILMPARFDNDTTLWLGLPQETRHHQITLLHDIQLNPEFQDSDFTVDLASLPLHSEIVDNRWGGTYRLGEDVVMLEGRLHQLPQIVDKPIDPDRGDDVLLGSTPIVDPAITDTDLSNPGRSPSDWLRLAGYLMVAAGAIGAVVLFFRHRFSGS